MALVFTSLAWIFADLSLGSALIQRSVITEADRSTVFWTTLATGAVMTLVGVALAPVAGAFFSMPSVTPLFAVASLLTFLSALGSTQMALLSREMNFRSLEIREIASTLFGTAVGITMALSGFGAWTIIGQALFTAAASALLVWRLSTWRPKWIYSRESLRTFGSFGIKTLLSKILGYIIVNTDNLLIGRYLGSFSLGVYTIAYNLMVLPAARIALPVQTVFYAAFARLQDDTAPTRSRLAARHPVGRVDQRAGLPGAGHHRAGFRPGRPRPALGQRRAGSPVALPCRGCSQLPDAGLERHPGRRSSRTRAALHDVLRCDHRAGIRARVAVGDRWGGSLLRRVAHDLRWSSSRGRLAGRSRCRSWNSCGAPAGLPRSRSRWWSRSTWHELCSSTQAFRPRRAWRCSFCWAPACTAALVVWRAPELLAEVRGLFRRSNYAS